MVFWDSYYERAGCEAELNDADAGTAFVLTW